MPKLVDLTPDLFPALHEAFLRDDDPYSDRERWRHVFFPPWAEPNEGAGKVLVEGNAVVGLLGMVRRTRTVGGTRHEICNLHTWWVHPDHRAHAVAMLRPFMSDRTRTYTYLTPGDRVRAIMKPLGFTPLSSRMRLLLPLRSRDDGPDELIFDDAIDEAALSPDDRTIAADHRPYGTGRLAVRTEAGTCLVVYTHVERYRVRYCHIHHVGDRTIFEAHEPRIRKALMKRHAVWLVGLDHRLWQDAKLKRSLNFPAPAHALVRPAAALGDLDEIAIDNLYSDVAMLSLAAMPSLRHELVEPLRRRFLPHLVKPL